MKTTNTDDNSATMGNLPSEYDLERQIMLTSSIAWKHGLTKNELEKWLSNFKGEKFNIQYERQLALWLLANFVYYNETEVRHLCKTLYHDFIHEMLIDRKVKDNNVENSIMNILSTSRFYYLGRPGESGAYLLYYFRQENFLPLNNFIFHPDDLPYDVSTIVFIDDVTLSSGKRGQASNYLSKAMSKYFKGKKSVLLTFIATKKTITDIEARGTKVISSILLDDRNKCFSNESLVFHHFKKHKVNCKIFADYYGKKIRPSYSLGYNNGQFIFGFFYNTPDNSLPIFWADNNGWYPIIKRYDKNYDRSKYIELERFV